MRRARTTKQPKVGLRGVTLIEVLVTLAIVAVLAGGTMVGLGAIESARLRESSTQVAAAVRVAYNHANATSRPTRLVFDFQTRKIWIEQSEGRMYLQSGERTGGASGATELEKSALEEADSILGGVKAERASFGPIEKVLGFEFDEKQKGSAKTLRDGIEFLQVEVQHEEDPVSEERAYLYFFPGGLTERAAIQIRRAGGEDDEDDIITIIVHPLTGKTQIVGGAVEMPRPRSDEEASERIDSL